MAKIRIETEVDVKFIIANAHVRYWEDSTINGVLDDDGDLTPCRDGDNWNPTIDIETGIVSNWPKGTIADISFKVCDEGIYQLVDSCGHIVKKIDGYVPSIMCPEEDGYGDYIIMKIDGDGKIANWKIDLSDFQEDED